MWVLGTERELRYSYKARRSSPASCVLASQQRVCETKVYPLTFHDDRRGWGVIEVQVYSFFNFEARWGGCGNAAPRSLYLQERASLPIVQEAGFFSGIVCMRYVKSTLPQPSGVGTTNCPSRSDWLYGLRHSCGYKNVIVHN